MLSGKSFYGIPKLQYGVVLQNKWIAYPYFNGKPLTLGLKVLPVGEQNSLNISSSSYIVLVRTFLATIINRALPNEFNALY